MKIVWSRPPITADFHQNLDDEQNILGGGSTPCRWKRSASDPAKQAGTKWNVDLQSGSICQTGQTQPKKKFHAVLQMSVFASLGKGEKKNIASTLVTFFHLGFLT